MSTAKQSKTDVVISSFLGQQAKKFSDTPISTDGHTLFSYTMPIARHAPNKTMLIIRYANAPSSTTRKHVRAVESATRQERPDLFVSYVEAIDNDKRDLFPNIGPGARSRGRSPRLSSGSTLRTKTSKKAKPASKASSGISFNNIEAQVLIKGMDVTGQSDLNDNNNLMDYASEAIGSFAREYVANNVSRDDDYPSERLATLEDGVRELVASAIEDAVQASMFKNVCSAIEAALEGAFERAEVGANISFTDGGLFTIAVNRDDIVRAWQRATDGVGYVAWDESLTADDIKGIDTLLSILRDTDEVYGRGSMQRTYEGYFDRFEPDTGSYSKLCKRVDPDWKHLLKETLPLPKVRSF